MQHTDIKLKPIQENLNGELAEKICYQCAFCEKNVCLTTNQRKLLEKLSGYNFYCNFCLQNYLHTKSNRHILPLSFRAIIGFYYKLIGNKIYFSQIEDHINKHMAIGLQNPLFRYDSETFLWFVDFNRVGKSKKKIPLNEVLKTIVEILNSFELVKNINGFKFSEICSRYDEAINLFYTKRYRPENKKILIPTLMGCGGICNTNNLDHDDLRNFQKKDFILK